MTKISATIVADSKNTFGNRLTTMMVTFPRYILAELNTHRMFSRNSASSRAIPFKKMVNSIKTDPFVPMAFQKDHSGMQGTEYFTGEEADKAYMLWIDSAEDAIERATLLNEAGVTKQLANRLLEPFMWHTVLVTATEWENFFALRCPQYYYEPEEIYFRSKKDWMKCYNENFNTDYDWDVSKDTLFWLGINKGQAEVHMMELAEVMWNTLNESAPKQLQPGEYHIPFGDDMELSHEFIAQHQISGEGVIETANKLRIKIATSRCARVSYTVVGEETKVSNYENDIKLYDRLYSSGHLSPFEHVGKAMTEDEYYGSICGINFRTQDETYTDWLKLSNEYNFKDANVPEEYKITHRLIHEHGLPYDDSRFGWSGNFRGFVQFRKTLNNENRT